MKKGKTLGQLEDKYFGKKNTLKRKKYEKEVLHEIAKEKLKIEQYERWVIVGTYGLYIGQWMTKKEAIEQHISEKDSPWRQCVRMGDRAIKAVITFITPMDK